MKKEIKEQLELVPHQSGVYRYYDSEHKILYVGKAKDLHRRVSSYFMASKTHSAKTLRLVSKIVYIEYTIVENESDAFLLENNLIKEFKPRYNILLKDDKTYPWICVKNEEFPRVFITRRTPKDGSRYFGPYTSGFYANQMIKFLHETFLLRTCSLALTESSISGEKYKICLQHHLHRCQGPCAGLQSAKDYNLQVEAVCRILGGHYSQALENLRQQMLEHAAGERFEQAQICKERMDLLQSYQKRSVIVSSTQRDLDVFALVMDNDKAYGNFMHVTSGSIVQSMNFSFNLPMQETQEEVLDLFMARLHERTGALAKEILVPFMPTAIWDGRLVHVPEKGDKKQLLDLSMRNAGLYKMNQLKMMEKRDPNSRGQHILLQLQKDLGLKELPLHIECFDNSNIMGTFPVSSCVVFKQGRPSKKDYRHFNVKTVTGANDFASMEEVVNRRYSRLIAEGASLPQLIVIDGGKGQVTSAYAALCALNLEHKIAMVGLAKRMEEVIVPGRPDSLFLDKNSASLRLMMQLRDEAHRFGITHHRQRRSAAFAQSDLLKIKGIGPKIADRLLTSFGSLARIKAAEPQDLERLVGKKLAEAVNQAFKEGLL